MVRVEEAGVEEEEEEDAAAAAVVVADGVESMLLWTPVVLLVVEFNWATNLFGMVVPS